MNSSLQLNKLPAVMFVTGIGTDVGKSYATGWLAKKIMEEGKTVITQKLIQTGNRNFSEDIEVHRRLMGIGMQPRDLDHTTAPIIFSYPASPHLASRIDERDIDLSIADESTHLLSKEYDYLLIEGAGGLMVPITEEYFMADFAAEREMPTVVVVNGQLGAISHAVLTLEALKTRGIEVPLVIYNPYFDSQDKIVADENREYLKRFLAKHFANAQFVVMD